MNRPPNTLSSRAQIPTRASRRRASTLSSAPSYSWGISRRRAVRPVYKQTRFPAVRPLHTYLRLEYVRPIAMSLNRCSRSAAKLFPRAGYTPTTSTTTTYTAAALRRWQRPQTPRVCQWQSVAGVHTDGHQNVRFGLD